MGSRIDIATTQGDANAPRGAGLGQLLVKEGEEPWSQEDLDEVLTELDEHRDRVAGLLDVLERQVNGLMKDAGDGAGQDQADVGATSHERDQELLLLASERENLLQIDKALERIEQGTFGVCESCGGAIGKMRVMAFPRATLCMPCKQREERR